MSQLVSYFLLYKTALFIYTIVLSNYQQLTALFCNPYQIYDKPYKIHYEYF